MDRPKTQSAPSGITAVVRWLGVVVTVILATVLSFVWQSAIISLPETVPADLWLIGLVFLPFLVLASVMGRGKLRWYLLFVAVNIVFGMMWPLYRDPRFLPWNMFTPAALAVLTLVPLGTPPRTSLVKVLVLFGVSLLIIAWMTYQFSLWWFRVSPVG